MYVVDMSAWATADRTYTLPATALVGDRCGIMVSAGNASYELLVTAASGDTLNAIAGGTEWSRVFITGEVLIFRCIAASATWIVEYDGRIPMKGLMRLSTDATGESAATYTQPTAKSGVWTADINVGSICATATDRITARRACTFAAALGAAANATMTSGNNFAAQLTFSGTTNIAFYVSSFVSATAYVTVSAARNAIVMAVDDYLVFRYFSNPGNIGLDAGPASNCYSYFSAVEIL